MDDNANDSIIKYTTNESRYEFVPNKALRTGCHLELIGCFQYYKELVVNRTPIVALSPFVSLGNEKKFYVYLINNTSSIPAIEIWECTKSDISCNCNYFGSLFVSVLEHGSSFAVKNSGSDLRKISGDITCFELYISCTEVSKIKLIQLPISSFHCGNYQFITDRDIQHNKLTRPKDIAVHQKQTETILAVVNGICGRLFLFTRDAEKPFQISRILSTSDGILLSPLSSVTFSSSASILVSNYESKALLFKSDNSNDIMEVFKAEEQITGIYGRGGESGFYGWDAKSNRVGIIEESLKSKKLTVRTILGPSRVRKPFSLATSPNLKIMLVTGRDLLNNRPVVNMLQL